MTSSVAIPWLCCHCPAGSLRLPRPKSPAHRLGLHHPPDVSLPDDDCQSRQTQGLPGISPRSSHLIAGEMCIGSMLISNSMSRTMQRSSILPTHSSQALLYAMQWGKLSSELLTHSDYDPIQNSLE